MYTLIQGIEVENPRRTLLFKPGDTIQDSAEALYTEGQAIVDVLDHFGIDGFAPGNWATCTARIGSLSCSGVGVGVRWP